MAIALERILSCSLEAFLAMQDEHFDKTKYMPIGVHYEGWDQHIVKNFAALVPNDALVVVDYRQTLSADRPYAGYGTALVPKDHKQSEGA